MALGPGKYDDLCTYVRKQAEADGAMVVVMNGNRGSGFSTQGDAVIISATIAILEQVLAQLKADRAKLQ